jgi:hypothetical protein
MFSVSFLADKIVYQGFNNPVVGCSHNAQISWKCFK